MGPDGISNVTVSSYAKDSAKKKKGGRFSKGKQNKFNARREQPLHQVKSKECNVMDSSNSNCAVPSEIPKDIIDQTTQGTKPARHREELHDLDQRDSERVPLIISQNKMKNGCDSFGNDVAGSRSSSTGSCFSFSSEEDRLCLDDWEAMADALAQDNYRQNAGLEDDTDDTELDTDSLKSDTLTAEPLETDCHYQGNGRAWSPDDTFRPRNLPSNTTQQQQRQRRNIASEQPTSCPICCEDLDMTDWSFFPCPCGFQLCLFCHNTILDADARCPGCRQHYAHESVSSLQKIMEY